MPGNQATSLVHHEKDSSIFLDELSRRDPYVRAGNSEASVPGIGKPSKVGWLLS